jgi:anti-sigma factor RsiW
VRDSTTGALLCERTREWISLELDGELSDFERALMNAHLVCCVECTEFQTDIRTITSRLRSERLEPVPAPVAPSLRRRRPVRVTQVAAAAAVVLAAAGLGSILGSVRLNGDSPVSEPPAAAAAVRPLPDPLLRDLRLAFLRSGTPDLGKRKPPLFSL